MSWLRKLLGGGEAAAKREPAPARPREPLVLPSAPTNAIQQWLEDRGVPWRVPRTDLAARYTTAIDPNYGWEAIQISGGPPLIDGLLGPLTVHTADAMSPRLPATYFSAHAWYVHDARENLARAVRTFEKALGRAEIEEFSNVVRCAWRAGPSSVSLTAWPPELQDDHGGEIEAHRRDRRLVTACHVAIESGLRPLLSERERAWLDGFVPIDALAFNPEWPPESPAEAPAAENELEFVREPPADLERFAHAVGRSADGEALIWCGRQLCIVPVGDILEINVDRVLPAKGGGGSRLFVVARLDGVETTSLFVTDAPGADDLTRLGEALAAATGRPLTLAPYSYDC